MILGLGLINQLNARSGTERFEARVGVRLVAARNDWQWRVYTRGVRPPEWEGAGGFEEVVCPPTAAVRGGRLWSEQVSWERALRRAPPDLLVALAFSPPAGSRIPFVMTVHDVTPLERPQDYAGPSGFYWSWVLRKVAPRAARLTTPSAWVRDRCAAALGYPPERIDVVHSGVEPRFFAERDPAQSRPRLERLGVRGPFWLHCGMAHPRKNLAAAVRALALLRQRGAEVPQLVGVGTPGADTRRVLDLARDLGVADRMAFAGAVGDDALADLYAGCDAFVFPSWAEGFGVPPLGALAAGARVLASRTTCLPEILGDAPFWADPADPATWVDAWERARAEAPAEAEARRRRGREWARRYTWDDTAARCRAAIERAIAERR
jgi:glycosyltransferase involved in cell wall biosynthesis